MSNESIADKFQRKLKVGEKTYVIRVIPAGKGMKIGLRLVKMVAPFLGGTMDELSSESDLFGEVKTFTELANKLVEVLNEDQLDEIIQASLNGAVIIEDGKLPRDLDFDKDFMANYGELIEVMAFALNENFSSIFKGKGIRHRFMAMVTNLIG